MPGHLDRFLVGLATQPRQKYDNIFTEEVTNHLFQGKNKSFGMDLVALNIQRGRDHGLPGYNAFRELCGLGRVRDFDLLADIIPSKIVDRLKMIYSDVDDIDLFIGGIVETSVAGTLSVSLVSSANLCNCVSGAIVGPTFRCLIGDQFKRLQQGDRFYYDNFNGNPGRFSLAQLQEVKHSGHGPDLSHLNVKCSDEKGQPGPDHLR